MSHPILAYWRQRPQVPSPRAASRCRGGAKACSPKSRPLAQFAEVIFFAGGGAAGVWAVVLGATVEQRIWNSALALVS